jgi:hypothetical protein
MSKIKVADIKANDLVEFTTTLIQGIIAGGTTLSGLVTSIQDYKFRDGIAKYIQIYTDKGLKGAYLLATEEATKTTMDEHERQALISRTRVRTLPRVIDVQGSDPEIFIVDKDNVVIPSFLFLKSNKDPNRIPEND